MGTTPCVLDDVRMEPFADPRFQLTGGAAQLTLQPGQRHVARLTSPDAGSGILSSALGFHVLNPDSGRELIPLFAP